MIKDYDGNKQTPKAKAEDLLYDGITTRIEYWTEGDGATDGMTDKEIQKVTEQMKKIANRLLKVLKFEPRY